MSSSSSSSSIFLKWPKYWSYCYVHTGMEVCRLTDNVRIWARGQKCLKALSEDREWRRSCDVSRQVVPYRGAGSCECATADCGSTNDRYVQTIKAGRTQSSSRRHVCDARGQSLLLWRMAMWYSVCRRIERSALQSQCWTYLFCEQMHQCAPQQRYDVVQGPGELPTRRWRPTARRRRWYTGPTDELAR